MQNAMLDDNAQNYLFSGNQEQCYQVQHVPGSTSLLIQEQHSNQPIRFEGQVYS